MPKLRGGVVDFLILLVSVISTIKAVPYESSAKQKAQLSFTSKCNELRTYEKQFDGQCSLIDETIYNKIMENFDFINQVDSKMSISEFLKFELMENYTNYFREKYAEKIDYIEKLDGTSF
jgi:hypothetical protein